MSTRDYLQHLLCCGNNASRQHYDSSNTMNRNDYEAIHDRNNSSKGGTNNYIDHQLLQDNPNCDSTFDLFEDVFGAPAKEPTHHPSPKYTLESNGFYYSRQAESGSKYLLLGMMPDRELVGDVIKLDLEYSCMTQMRPGIKLRITGIHQKHKSTNSQYRFKMKLVNIESVSDESANNTYDDEAPDATVCHVDTKFLSTDELKRHLFKIYSYNNGVLENLQLRIELYYKRNNECMRAEYLGKAKFTLNGMDPTGVSARKEGVLLRRDWKHRLSSS